MSDRLSADYVLDEANNRVLCTIRVVDSALLGHAAELRLVRRVEVKDRRPVNAKETLFTRSIASLAPTNRIEMHRSSLQAYSYHGSMIDVEIHTEIEIDDGVIFDTTVTEKENLALGGKPAISEDAKGIVEPADAFDFIANFKAIPPRNKMITAVLMLIAGLIIGINSIVGVHDQFSPSHRVWFYDHRASDGDSESPVGKSLAGSGVLGAAVWLAIRQQLRKYMSFELCNVPEQIRRYDTIRASAILRGRARVDLRDVILRVVACNMEKGKYKRGSGTKERTVSFTEPVRAVVLYDQRISLIPAGAPVESYFGGEIAFEPMFAALYPPQM
ncbi:MAG: hypothetical protein LC732_05510, partial [Acidobacteria bacterium]|nr:hypothetical protein [Acidobacteriota bacterium]